MFVGALFQIAKKLETIQMSKMNKVGHIHTMKYYSAMEGIELLIHVTISLNLEKFC